MAAAARICVSECARCVGKGKNKFQARYMRGVNRDDHGQQMNVVHLMSGFMTALVDERTLAVIADIRGLRRLPAGNREGGKAVEPYRRSAGWAAQSESL